MPVSRRRKKNGYSPPTKAKAPATKAVRFDSPRWLPITMVALWVVGLVWIVAWYMVPLPLLESLGVWNLVIGFGLISVGFILATRWK